MTPGSFLSVHVKMELGRKVKAERGEVGGGGGRAGNNACNRHGTLCFDVIMCRQTWFQKRGDVSAQRALDESSRDC